MPEIFIADEASGPSEKELKARADQIEELEQIAAFAEWFGKQSETVQELGRELDALQAARGMNRRFMLETEERYGRPLFVAHCANGRHESRQSPEHALFLLVDSFRTRAEDKAETHARIMQIHGMDLKAARRFARELAKEIQDEHGKGVPGETRDKFLDRALDEQERELAAARSRPPKAKPRKPPSVK